jgi:salicylate hydroxylase
MRILIAGGGIGGLTTAIALRHQGIDALVLEQAEVMAEIGAGIQIASNAAIVLREIGVEAAIRAVGVKPLSYDYRDLRTGRTLYQAPLGDEAAQRYGAPMYNIHRADLMQILFDAPRCPSPTIALRSACRPGKPFARTRSSAATVFIRSFASICAVPRRNTSPIF